MWQDLEADITELFSDVRAELWNGGVRFYRSRAKPRTAPVVDKKVAAVERVREWRKKNRERRNEIARAAYARDPERYKMHARTSRARAKGKDEPS